MLLENLTWPEVKKLKLANKVVVLPLGSFEQHGPHSTASPTNSRKVWGAVERVPTRL